MAKVKILSLKESFLELQGTVLNASLYFDAWWELKNAANPAHDAYQKSIDRYPLFFIAAADAQLLAVFVLLYQVYEMKQGTTRKTYPPCIGPERADRRVARAFDGQPTQLGLRVVFPLGFEDSTKSVERMPLQILSQLIPQVKCTPRF
jgi:hypothetical protein